MLLPLTAALLTVPLLLQATVAVSPAQWTYRQDKVTLAVTLTNPGDRPITVLVGNTSNDHFFFDLRLVNPAGKVIASGTEPRFVVTTDLPVGIFQTIAPHGTYRAVLDWRILYNLAPGTYRLSAVFRVEPEQEPHAAAYYTGEIKEHHAFTGRVMSQEVTVVVTPAAPKSTPAP
jgi:hypothetical protein